MSNVPNGMQADFPTDSDQVIVTLAAESSHFAMTFRLKRNQPLKLVKEAFASYLDWHAREFEYVFQGRVVEDDATPEQLAMESHDNTIEISIQYRLIVGRSESGQQNLDDAKVELLHVTYAEGGIDFNVRACGQYLISGVGGISVRVAHDCSLGGVMLDFERLAGYWSLRFLSNGHRIKPGDTPNMLEMRDGDDIDVYLDMGPTPRASDPIPYTVMRLL
ncbi:unnamed protein product [Cercospora beticola]|nr:unnamed protein product [Cercospora beticola]